MDKRINQESGQAIVIIVLAIVVLLGFVAIAVDGGMAYSDRRYAQNASDASSLAGGGAAALALENQHMYYDNWQCVHWKMQNVEEAAINSAIARAADNGFSIDDDPDDWNGVVFECEEGKDNGAYVEKYINVTTFISDTTTTYFAQFVFGGQLRNRVQAITQIKPRSPFAYGNAVVALNTDACSGNQNGVMIGGSNSVYIKGGGIFSNGCLTCNGTGFSVEVDDGTIRYAGETDCSSSSPMVPAATNAPIALPEDSYALDAPDCSQVPVRSQTGGMTELLPGRYDKITMSSSGSTLLMHPGLYCLSGSPHAFNISGGTLTAYGVTIYVAPSGGRVEVSGNANAYMSAPDKYPDPSPAIGGVLFYSESSVNNALQLTGNGVSNFVGAIFVPNGDIKLTGSSNLPPGQNATFHTQLIGKNVDISGNANVDINFNAALNHGKPTKLELFK